MSIASEIRAEGEARTLRKIMDAGKETARPDVIDFCKGFIFPVYLTLMEDAYSEVDEEWAEYWRNI